MQRSPTARAICCYCHLCQHNWPILNCYLCNVDKQHISNNHDKQRHKQPHRQHHKQHHNHYCHDFQYCRRAQQDEWHHTNHG